jgi:hypothetical protein
MAFWDRSKSTALRNCHYPNYDPRRDFFYQFSTPQRFYTAKTQKRRSMGPRNSLQRSSVAIFTDTRFMVIGELDYTISSNSIRK